MVDGFSERYGDLLAGSYDCVDRIVLNAYNSLCHSQLAYSRNAAPGCGLSSAIQVFSLLMSV